jgi:hypothetical protein
MRKSLGSFCCLALFLGSLLPGCQKSDPKAPVAEQATRPPWFADVSAEVGLDFKHEAGPVETYLLPQIIGSGAALFDFNNDGLLDIYLLQNGGPESRAINRLYQQLPGGHFKDVSAGSGLDIAGHNMGVAIGDVNNDGWPDVLVTQYRGIKLFLNNGNGTFTDVTTAAGLDDPLWATSASFVDYDRDGWLDLVVVHYVDYDPSWPCTSPGGIPDYCAPKVFPGTVTKLFHNLGRLQSGPTSVPPAHFEDVTVTSGLGRLAGPGLGVICADFDGDGWPDIFVANDGAPNHLWINQHNGTFKEEAALRGVAYNVMGQAEGNMGIALGDIDGDGLFDLFVTHLTREAHTLWKQGPRGSFRDQTALAGLVHSHWRGTGFGTLMGDFNQDGALDVALVNGRVAKGTATVNPDLGPFWSQYGERNQLFANDGTGRFRDISLDNPALCGSAGVFRGLCVGDIDGDGALDLLVTELGRPARLYRNVTPDRGHWLLVRALDPALNRDALGAEVTVRVKGRRWVRWVNPGGSYLCSSDPRAHFGLGPADRIEAIDVLWPDGKKETFPGGKVDRQVVLRKGEGTPGE